MPLMGVREYARHRGVSDAAVRKAIASGRIERNEDGKIDSVEADRRWDANTDPAMQRVEPQPQPKAKPAVADSSASAPAADEDDGSIPDFADSKAEKEYWLSKTAKAEYRMLIGDLLPRSEVEAAWIKAASLVKAVLLKVPAKHEPSNLVRRAALTELIHAALSELANADVVGQRSGADVDDDIGPADA